MPATASPFDAIPGTDALQPAIGSLPSTVALPRIDADPAALGRGLADAAPTGIDAQLRSAMPDLSGAPSPTAFRSALDEPLSSLTSVNGASLMEEARGSIPAAPARPDFPVNDVVGKITGAVLPPEAAKPRGTVDPGLPSELGDFTAPLRRMAEAGAATPLRLLHALLAVLDRLVDTATDVDKLKAYTTEALQEILLAQCADAKGLLPLASLEAARAAIDGGFVARYATLLDGLDRAKKATGAELLAAVEAARAGAPPQLRTFGRAGVALRNLKNDDAAALDQALKQVVGFATSDEVFLKSVFDSVEARIATVLDAVAEPVRQLTAMIDQIRGYLEKAAEGADAAAKAVADKLDAALRTVGGYLEAARERIEEIAGKVKEFVDKVNVGPAVEAFKRGCAQVTDAVDRFFTEVERARQQLDRAVADLSKELEKRFDDGLKDLKALIERLLKEITDLLDRDEVKQVLDQARQGVEKLKTAVDQASLQAVFDLVVRKTGELEGRIQAIDTARLGTPQKTALKVGVKVIEAVNVDDVIRPELEAAFAEILQPLRELISLLKDRVLIVEQKIDEFNPGSVVVRKVEPHLRPLFDALDSFRPSKLLEPIKDGLAKLEDVLGDLDPQRLLDRLQSAYGQLVELVAALEPTPLGAEISRAANTAVSQITQVRDVHLEDLLTTIRENVSLRKLLEGTGIQEIADAEFWGNLRKVLGGEYLDRLTAAMDRVETRLGAEFSTLDYSLAAAAVADLAAAVSAQRLVSTETYRPMLAGLAEAMEAVAGEATELERRRKALLEGGDVERPEVEAALREIDLAPFMELLTAAREAAALVDEALTPRLATVKAVCTTTTVTKLKAMKEDQIRAAVPAIFKTQFGDPVRGFVTRTKVKLQPFTEAVDAIQGFLTTTLVELPKRVDAAVGKVLDTVRTDLRKAAGEVIATIRTLSGQITGVISAVYEQVKKNVDQLDPTLVLNSFVLADFVGEGNTPDGLRVLAKRIASPGDDEAAALLQARLTADQLELVRRQGGAYSVPVLAALNGVLRDAGFASRLTPGARAKLEAERKRLDDVLKGAEGDAYVAARKALIRTISLDDQLTKAQRAAGSGPAAAKAAGLVRLNRVLLEVQYPEALKMGLQALHPYVVAMVGQLYPEETVQRIDRTYVNVVTRLKGLPEELVQKPLDEAFGKVKDKLHETFDIRGLFRVLDIKLEGMEGDLSIGLDRLSVAYDHLLGTLDARLS